MISVKGLTKEFRVHQKDPGLKGSLKALVQRQWIAKKALQEVSFEVEAGEIVGLIGANGAGKTTLVKCLSGVIVPTRGEATVLGFTPWQRQDDFRRQIALIMGQKAQLWWDLPAADCFILLREIYQVPKKDHAARLAYLSETLGVKEQLKIQIRRLSLGERMKMEIIAALLHQPRVVFLDEPTIGLDLTAQSAIRNFILEYRKLHRPATLLTSHYMEDIEKLCKRIIILREGQVIYNGLLQDVVTRYARHKVMTVQLDNEASERVRADPSLQEMGELLSLEEGILKFKVLRDRIPEVAAHFLRDLPVLDLSIEEEEIGTIIESIQRGGTR